MCSSDLLKILREWQPFYYLPIQYWQLLYVGVVMSIIILVLVYATAKKNDWKINLWDISISLIFLFLALKSRRHFPLLFIISFPLLIYFFTNFFKMPIDSFINKKLPKEYFIIKPYIMIAMLLIIAAKLIGANYITDPFISTNKFPRDAIEFLKQNPEFNNLKLFNKYGWGGYLIWMLPEKKLFIDGRLSQFPYAEHTLLEEYLEFFQEKKVEKKIKDHNIKLVLIPQKENYYKLNWFEKHFLLLNEENINKSENYLKKYLNNSLEWAIAYSDDVSSIYVKNK